MWKTVLTRKFLFKTEEIKDWMQKFDPVILGFKWQPFVQLFLVPFLSPLISVETQSLHSSDGLSWSYNDTVCNYIIALWWTHVSLSLMIPLMADNWSQISADFSPSYVPSNRLTCIWKSKWNGEPDWPKWLQWQLDSIVIYDGLILVHEDFTLLTENKRKWNSY